MPIDPTTSLAFALQSQPGVYALLVGSGVSRSAEIPTGWGITLELLRRLAAVEEQDPGDDRLEQWYENASGEPVGFSTLLEELASSKTDRQALLAQFIEPEPDNTHRRPTAAHRAIAQLVVGGFIRIVITTNFDHLIEQAIADAGIQPIVLAGIEAISGAAPFQHQQVVVLKLHGDYRDPGSMLVTESELDAYDPAVTERLARTLEDHGLIACGWSGEWDPALRAEIMRARSRRYPFYFAHQGALSPEASSVVEQRAGSTVAIEDADTFFSSLARKVFALEAASTAHPLDIAALVVQTKACLPHVERIIELDDLVSAENSRAVEALADLERFPTSSGRISNDYDGYRYVADQALRYAAVMAPLMHVVATGAAYPMLDHEAIWRRTFERFSATSVHGQGTSMPVLTDLRRLPLLTMIYTASIACIHRQSYSMLRSFLIDAQHRDEYGAVPLVAVSHPWRSFANADLVPSLLAIEATSEIADGDELFRKLRDGTRGRMYTPISDWLHALCRAPLQQLIPEDSEYTNTFDRTELFLALVASDIHIQKSPGDPYIDDPYFGAFTWRNRSRGIATLEETLAKQARTAGSEWLPLKVGFFGRDVDRLDKAIEAMIEGAIEARGRRW